MLIGQMDIGTLTPLNPIDSFNGALSMFDNPELILVVDKSG